MYCEQQTENREDFPIEKMKSKFYRLFVLFLFASHAAIATRQGTFRSENYKNTATSQRSRPLPYERLYYANGDYAYQLQKLISVDYNGPHTSSPPNHALPPLGGHPMVKANR
ncbi:hypothetical protein U9M48_036513 [Paspalum notatum var. saurae]|uniref:Uncharacterized protein n=1 Tax=Paspalum notatum var. saurae TaxID=547442 RepID=A0AAQ3X8E4_PASNO